MRVVHRAYDLSGARKAIDEYIINPIEGTEKLLYFLQDRTISFNNIPKAKQTKELLMVYLDMPEVTYVRTKWISKKLFDDEVWRKLAPKCHDYEDIPQRYLTEDHYYSIVRSEYYATYNLHLIPAESMTEELMVEALATTFDCLRYSELNSVLFERFDIAELKKKALKLRRKRKKEKEKAEEVENNKRGWVAYKKGYNPETGKFFFNGKESRYSEELNLEFDSFDEFYKFLLKTLPQERRNSDNPKPLKWVDLSLYDFKDTDLSGYDLSGCLIRTEFLEKSKCFLDYSTKILANPDNAENDIQEDKETALISYENQNPVHLGDTSAKNFQREDYHYISDIHLTHRIINRLGNHFTKEQVAFLIKEIVQNISKTGITLIAGDTSESFAMNKMFYSLLAEHSYGTRIIILGNHELWDESLYGDSPVDDVVDSYRELFDKERRHFLLQNELYIETSSFRYILSESEILEKNCDEIAELCEGAGSIILGGIGFTGYCRDMDPQTGRVYNAAMGLYRGALKTLEEDILQTQRFEAVYEKVRESLSDRKVIVLTHTPKECWSKEPYVTNWVYVNGHTHRNIEIVNEEKMLFADNQIGYHNESVHLKTFCVFRNRDLFYEHLEDGIHEITAEQYREFNRSKGIYTRVNAGIGKILMLKKKKQYMFLVKKHIKSAKGERLYILDGGTVHKADFDEKYYYENMDVYVNAVKSVFKDYWTVQKEISKVIKKIGGNGTVHGCIIDIDYFNHAYLNPFDGTLTFYFATSMTRKYVYENLESLLQDRAAATIGEDDTRYIDMARNYQKLISKDNERSLQTVSSKPVFVGSTDMYRVSRIIKRLQHINDNNVLRVWHNGVLVNFKNKGRDALMDFSASFSLMEIEDKYEID